MTRLNNTSKGLSTVLLILVLIGQLAIAIPVQTCLSSPIGTGSRTAETGYWHVLPAMNIARYDHTMHIFENDSYIAIGGFDGAQALSNVEVYSPFMGNWVNVTPMHTARWGHASVSLVNKSILVVGGYGTGGNPLKSAELFDVASYKWFVLPDMPFANGGANLSAARMTNGSVLVIGGNSGTAATPNVVSMAAIYDVINNTWSTIPVPKVAAMGRESFFLLNHTIMTIGGSSGSPWYKGVQSAEIFDPIAKKWVAMDDLTTARYMFGAVLLNSGNVLVSGGIRDPGFGYNIITSSEVFNSSSNNWEPGPQMLGPRYGHSANLLPDSEVLVAGGQNATSFLNSTEVLEIASGKSVKAPSMHIARTRHASIKTSKGDIVVSGGLNSGGATASVEIFKPGVKQSSMSLDINGLSYVQSEGPLSLTAHVYNQTTGDLQGAMVTFISSSQGYFDTDVGATDIKGTISTLFHAPKNSAAHTFTVPITVTANLWGYEQVVGVINIDVFPETRGTSMKFNQSAYHLGYVTMYGPGSPYLSGSFSHSGIDFLGDEQAKVDEVPVVVANFSTWEHVEQSFVSGGLNHQVITEQTGYYYFEYDLRGTVFSVTNRTSWSHIYNATYQSWYNLTEIITTRYLPSMKGFNTSIVQIGKVQDVVNTFRVTTYTKNLDTGAEGTSTTLRSEPKSYLYYGYNNLTTIMGELAVKVFVDETGMVYDYYSKSLGILVQQIEYNETGETESTKTLLEYNDVVGEDPTSPLLEVTLSLDSSTLEAGTSMKAHATVTSGGKAVPGATILASLGKGISMTPVQGVTDQEGKFDMNLMADKGAPTTDLVLTVLVNKTGFQKTSASITVTLVQDITPPSMSHVQVTQAEEGSSIDLFAMVTDDVGVLDVVLYYHLGGSVEFVPVTMELFLGAYKATIPGDSVLPPLLEYYIQATDVNGNKAVLPTYAPIADIYQISVSPVLNQLTPVSILLDGGGSVTVTAAVRGNLTLTVSRVDNPDLYHDARFLGTFASVRAVGSGQLVWANISFTYNHYLLGTLAERELRVYWWDQAGQSWMTITDTGVLTDKEVVWANVTHLTVFAPRAQTPPIAPPAQDKVPPTVTLISPSDKASLNQGLIQVRGIAIDNAGLSQVQVKVDNGAWIDVWVPAGSKYYNWAFNMTLVSGVHIISARAKDQAGNIGNQTSISVTGLTEKKEGPGVTMRTVTGAFAALLVVAFMILIIFIIGNSSEEEERPIKKAQKAEKPVDEDEEIGEEE